MPSFSDFETPTNLTSSGAIRPAPAFNEFIDSLEQTESNGGVNLWNARTGATGPLQVTPIAAKDIGGDYNRAVEDHAYARGLGVQYARKLWKQFGEDPALVAAAYHTGPTKINQLLRNVPAGEDPTQWVVSQLGPEGRGHNEKVMGRFTGQLKYDAETGRFTEANAAKIKPTFSMFEGPTVGDLPLASESPPRRNRSDYNTINTDGSVNWDETWAKTKADAKEFGLNTLGVLNVIAGIPAFVLGSSVAAGSAGVGALGRLVGFGKSEATGRQEPVADITKKALEQGEHVSELFNKYFNPVTVALNAAKASEALDDTAANKVMGELTKAVKGYSQAMEKQYGVDAGAVEISVNQYMSMALARKGAGSGVGAENRPGYDPVKNQYGNARRPGRREQEVSDAEIVGETIGEPKRLEAPKLVTFDQFSIDGDLRAADAFIKETLEDAQKADAAATKSRMLKGAAIVSAPAIIAGGAYLYNKFKPQGNQVIDPGTDAPEPSKGNEIAGRTVTGDEYDKLLNQFGSLAAIPFAIGAVKGKGGMWHPEAVERLSQPLVKRLLGYGEGGQAVRGGGLVETADASGKPVVDWSQRAIRNYLNKHAGTATDPLKDVEIPFGEGVKRWEDLWDQSVVRNRLSNLPQDRMPETMVQKYKEGKLDLGETIYDFSHSPYERRDFQAGEAQVVAHGPAAIKSYLSHVGDYLHQNVDPAKLQQYDLVRAVKETAANDARVDKEIEKAASASTKDLPVYKEYPDGMKWVELRLPEKLTAEQKKGIRVNQEAGYRDSKDQAYEALDVSGRPLKNTYTNEIAIGRTPEEAHLAGQLAQEGNQMGHCVGGYCEGVASRDSRIFSLRDKKGKSHVTIEVQPRNPTKLDMNKEAPPDDFQGTTEDLLKAGYGRMSDDILQIKGKQNRAPVAEYLPYVQDFVKSGKWGEVGDLGNTGLVHRETILRNPNNIISKLHKEFSAAGLEGLSFTIRETPKEEFNKLDIPTIWIEKAKQLNEAQSRLERNPHQDFVGSRAANSPKVLKHLSENSQEYFTHNELGKIMGEGIKFKNQEGSVDPRLLKALAIAGVGAVLGAAASDYDKRLFGALVGGGGALGLAALGRSGAKGRSPVQSLDYGLGIISTRLRNISEPLRFRAVEYERTVLRDMHATFDKAHPFLKALDKVPKAKLNELNRAIISNEPGAINKVIQGIGDPALTKGWQQTRSLLQEIGNKWKDQGRISGLMADYFPRIVKDVDGLLTALGKENRVGIDKALQKAELEAIKSRGTGLTQLEESIIINRVLQNWRENSGQLGPAKARKIKEVTDGLVQFYATPSEALHSYISTVVRDLQKAKFFGNELAEIKKGNVTYLDIDTSIGNVVRKELDAGRIDNKQAQELQSIIKSRFTTGEQGSTPWVQDVKNLANAGLLGNIVSAVTQFGDAAIPIYLHGFRSSFASTIRNLTGQAKINVKDFGLIDHIAEEFANKRTSANALQWLFRYSGFSSIDRFGKNITLGSALSRYERLAHTVSGRKELASKYQASLGEEFPQLLRDLQAKKRTDLVDSILFSELSNVQPITRMEVPQGYLDHPNGRVLYMLKTFMIKQLDIVRRDGYNEIKKGNVAKGVGNLARYALILGIAGATTDQVKNWILGRNDPFEARDIWMNILKTFGWSEYTINKATKDGKPVEAVAGMAVPPYRMMDDILRLDPKAIQYIPIIGKLLYDRAFGGNQKATDAKLNRDMMRLSDPETDARIKQYRNDRNDLYRLYQRGDIEKFDTGLEKLKDKYNLTDKQEKAIRETAKLPADVRKFKSLPLEQQRVILQKSSPEQQERFRPHAKKELRN